MCLASPQPRSPSQTKHDTTFELLVGPKQQIVAGDMAGLLAAAPSWASPCPSLRPSTGTPRHCSPRRASQQYGEATSILGAGGGEEGLEKIPQRSKCFLLKKGPKQRKQEGRTSKEMIVFDHLTTHNSKVLNNELNWRNTDWAKEASEIKSLLAKSKKSKEKSPLILDSSAFRCASRCSGLRSSFLISSAALVSSACRTSLSSIIRSP